MRLRRPGKLVSAAAKFFATPSSLAVRNIILLPNLPKAMSGHGFRHTMSTIMHDKGFNTAWIETQFAHVDKNAIRGTYDV